MYKSTSDIFFVLLFLYKFLFFFISVKFLREVTPYFRKASIISEVGWELQRAFLCPLGPGATSSPPAPRSPPRADTRYIPLQLTHLARNLKYHDPGKLFFFYWFSFGGAFFLLFFIKNKTKSTKIKFSLIKHFFLLTLTFDVFWKHIKKEFDDEKPHYNFILHNNTINDNK